MTKTEYYDLETKGVGTNLISTFSLLPEKKRGKAAQVQTYRMEDVVSKYGNNFQEMHSHDFYSISWYSEGECKMEVDFDKFHINENTIILTSPGYKHKAYDFVNLKGIGVSFTQDFFNYMGDELTRHLRRTLFSGNPVLLSTKSSVDLVNEKLSLLESECLRLNNHSEYEKLSVYSLLMNFLCALISLPEYTHQEKNKVVIPYEDLFYNFLDIVEKEFRITHSIEQLALSLNVTPKILLQCTKANAGQTPSQILKERLLLQAKREILFSNKNMVEISNELGFNVQSNFTAFFKNAEGMSPSQFRNAAKETK